MSEVFCDWVTTTFNGVHWPEVRAQLEPSLDAVGARLDVDTESSTLWRADEGTVNAKRFGPVTSVSASGSMLAGLRAANVFGKFLATLASVPHNVTRVDAALDIPEDTPPVIERLINRVSSSEGIALTRKRINPKNAKRVLTRRSDGLDTGSIYLGARTAEVFARVYDKRQQRIDRGLPDNGPLTRYEVEVHGGLGPTLRDALDPESLFWHFMAPDVLPRPEHVAPWVSHAIGFEVDWPEELTPAQRLVRRLDASADVVALLRLAEQVGPGGFDFLVSRLRRMQRSDGGAADNGGPSDVS